MKQIFSKIKNDSVCVCVPACLSVYAMKNPFQFDSSVYCYSCYSQKWECSADISKEEKREEEVDWLVGSSE